MRRVVVVVVLLVLIVAGCGGSANGKRRDAVNTYFDRVARAEAKLVARSKTIEAALGSFTPGTTTPGELRGLVSARATVREALRRVRAIDPPPEAARLHGDLVRLLALQASVANELVWSARFIPQLAATVRPLADAAAALSRDLGAAKTVPRSVAVGAGAPRPTSGGTTAPVPQVDVLGVYAAAFARYRKALQPTSTTLERLVAPPELAPRLAAERRAVRRSVELSAEIEQALRRRDVPRANAGIRSFFGVATEINGIRTQKAEQAAVRAYDARLSRIGTLARQVATERQRLVQTIG